MTKLIFVFGNYEVCHPHCVLKTNSKANSVRKHNYNYMLDDGIY